MAKLREVILLLVEGTPLPFRYKDHPLAGEWSHHRDCHIEPDWLLIYKVDGDDLISSEPGRIPTCSKVRPTCDQCHETAPLLTRNW